MGVKHQPRDTSRDEEYYEPIDGLPPQDHLQAYYLLAELRCILPRQGYMVYRNQRGTKVCHPCRVHIPRGGRLFPHEGYHSIIHEESLEDVDGDCSICQRVILASRPAWGCTECIETALNTPARVLLAGEEVEVVTNW
ncbi:hypothetical protein KM043_016059 [Ampulex compressa]|nr:hypothetical protein KM043_016059 [Ampulex compressa]